MHVHVRVWTCIHVPVPPFLVCSPCARVCTCVDVHPRDCTGPPRCLSPLHLCVRVLTCIHVTVPALFGVYVLCTCVYASARGGVDTPCTCVYASGRASTSLYLPFLVCTPCTRLCARLDERPRVCTGPLPCASPVHVCVRVSRCIRVPVPALFGVYGLCTCVYACGRTSTCI